MPGYDVRVFRAGNTTPTADSCDSFEADNDGIAQERMLGFALSVPLGDRVELYRWGIVLPVATAAGRA